jgi:hypothetical protein
MLGCSMSLVWPTALHVHHTPLVSMQAAEFGGLMEDHTDIVHQGRRLQV